MEKGDGEAIRKFTFPSMRIPRRSMILCTAAVLSKLRRIMGLQVEDGEGRLTRRLKTAFVRGRVFLEDRRKRPPGWLRKKG
jgi:hypothetical protein